jgi:Zn-dependent protease
MMSELNWIQIIAVSILPVLFAVTVHEVAHGWVAKKYGDNTAFAQGRLTLNPIKHIDLVGTIIVPLLLRLTGTGFLFGWAKPVPVDPRNFKNPRQDMAIVALAGPVSNLLMALAWALIARAGVMIHVEFVTMPLIYMGVAGISINLSLAFINLLPIPPLDGSRVVARFLPARLAWQYDKLERWGLLIMLALLYTKVLNLLLAVPMFVAQKAFFAIAGL